MIYYILKFRFATYVGANNICIVTHVNNGHNIITGAPMDIINGEWRKHKSIRLFVTTASIYTYVNTYYCIHINFRSAEQKKSPVILAIHRSSGNVDSVNTARVMNSICWRNQLWSIADA